jgi:hypothetical protein
MMQLREASYFFVTSDTRTLFRQQYLIFYGDKPHKDMYRIMYIEYDWYTELILWHGDTMETANRKRNNTNFTVTPSFSTFFTTILW